MKYPVPQPDMSADKTLCKIFPHEGAYLGRGGDEVNGLPADTVPHGKIISGVAQFEQDRVFHLVDCNDELLYLRVCKAMPGEGYDAFAVIHNRAPINSPKAALMQSRFMESLECGYLKKVPTSTVPTIDNAQAYLKAVNANPKGSSMDFNQA